MYMLLNFFKISSFQFILISKFYLFFNKYILKLVISKTHFKFEHTDPVFHSF